MSRKFEKLGFLGHTCGTCLKTYLPSCGNPPFPSGPYENVIISDSPALNGQTSITTRGKPTMVRSRALHISNVGRISEAAARGASLAGTPGAVLGSVYGASDSRVIKLATGAALGALAFGPIGAVIGAITVANPAHRQKAALAGAAGAYFGGPIVAGLGAAFLGR